MYKDNKDAIHTEAVKRMPDDISEMHPNKFYTKKLASFILSCKN